MKDLFLLDQRDGFATTIDALRAIPESIYLPGPASVQAKLLKGIERSRLHLVTEISCIQILLISKDLTEIHKLAGKKSLRHCFL